MKKLALTAVAVALAYTGTSWWLGGQVEKELDTQYAKLVGAPNVALVERSYERGVFSATETVTIEYGRDTMNAMAAAFGLDESPEPLRLVLRTHFKHGPLPGFSGFGAAVGDSELVLDEAQRKALAPLFGDQAPLAARTRYGLNGGEMVLTSPAFEGVIGEAGSDDATKLSSDGLRLAMRFGSGLAHYSVDLEVARFVVEDADGAMRITGLTAKGDQERLFEDEPLFYLGSGRIGLAGLEFDAPIGPDGRTSVSLGGLEYREDARVQDGFIDLDVRLGARSLKVGEHDWGPVQLDQRYAHLEARTMATLYRAFNQVAANPLGAMQAAEGDFSALLVPLAEPLATLLANAPEYFLDRLEFAGPHGKARLALKVGMPGVTPEDVGNPFGLLTKLVIDGEAEFPEALVLASMLEDDAGDEERAFAQAMLDASLEPLVDEGYVSRASGRLNTRLQFENGELLLNGKPFDPMMMAGGYELDEDDYDEEEDYEEDEDDGEDSE
ncbi:MAG: YdgA family protein [Rhodocyclaceae bacterium]